MPLQRQEVEIPLSGGLDTKSNADMQDAASVTAIDNLRWNKRGEYAKRPTHSESLDCSVGASAGSEYTSTHPACTVLAHGQEVLAQTDQWGLARRTRALDSDLADATAMRGITERAAVSDAEDDAFVYAPVAVNVERRFLESATYGDIVGADTGIITSTSAVTVVGGREILVYAYVAMESVNASGGTIHARAIDPETWTVLRESETVDLASPGLANACALQACAISESSYEGVLITYSDGTTAPVTIAGLRYDARTNDFVAVAALTTNATLQAHTLVQSGTSFLLAYVDNTAAVGWVETRTLAGGVSSTHVSTRAWVTAPAIVVGTAKTLIAYNDAGLVNLYAETLNSPGASATIHTIPAGNIERVFAAAETRTGFADAAVVCAQITNTAHFNDGAIYGLVDFSLATPADHFYGALVPDVATLGAFSCRGRAHFVFQLEQAQTAIQTAGYLTSGLVCRAHIPDDGGSNLNARMDPVARVQHDRLPSQPTFWGAQLQASESGNFATFVLPADLTPDRQDYGGGVGVRLPAALAAIRLDMTPRPMPAAELPGATLIGGGLVHSYDGGSPHELSFACAPSVEASTNGAGSVTATVVCAAIWFFVDDSGNLHRSAPGFAASLAASSNRVDVEVSLPPTSGRDGQTTRRYGVELYVKDSAGTYRLANTANSEQDQWDALAGNFTFSVKFNSISIPTTGEPALYSDGTGSSELASESAPAMHALAVVGDRVWGIDSEDRTRIWPSKPLVAGFAPEFSSANTLHIGDAGVGIEDVGGVPTVFGERGIWQVYGAGPNALGSGAFAPARRLPHDVECVDPGSVCRTPEGVLFRGRKGMYLLGHDLSLQPVGERIDPSMYIEGSTSGFCRVVYDGLSNEAHVLDFGGEHFVLSMSNGQWSQWSQTDADRWIDAVSVGGRLWYLHHDATGNTVHLRDARPLSEAAHASSTYTWSLTTPWLRLAGLNGLARVWEVHVAVRLPGTVANSGSIQVDYEVRDGTTNTHTWTAAQLAELGAPGEVVTLRVRPSQQVGPAFRLAIQELTPAGSTAGTIPLAAKIVGGVRPSGNRRQGTAQNQGSST